MVLPNLRHFCLSQLLAPLLMRFDQWCKATGFALGGVGVPAGGGDDARARATHAFGSDDLFASLDAGAGWPASWLAVLLLLLLFVPLCCYAFVACSR